MGKAYFKVQQQFCGECAIALRRFIGGIDGVSSVQVENGMVSVDYDEDRTKGLDVQGIARDSIERLGYRIDGE